MTEERPRKDIVRKEPSASQRRASGDTNPSVTLILDFQPPELCENTIPLSNPPKFWYFVIVVLIN